MAFIVSIQANSMKLKKIKPPRTLSEIAKDVQASQKKGLFNEGQFKNWLSGWDDQGYYLSEKAKKDSMRGLVACEESDEVRSRFEARGFDVWSCDLQPNRNPQAKHYQGSVFDILNDGWDFMIGFPPCTRLAVSGARHFEQKRKDGRQQEGIDFFMALANAPIEHISLENPMGIMSTVWRKPDQIIQPYYFGDEAQKTTCLWLKGFPKLYHNESPNLFDTRVTHVSKGDFYISPSGKKMPKWCSDPEVNGKKLGYNTDEIKKLRSKTFPGIAQAMADQWGDYLINKLKRTA